MDRNHQRPGGPWPWVALLTFVAVAQAAGLIGLPFTDPGDQWFEGLDKPFFMPPNSVFGPVWTVLYLAIGVAGWLIWRAERGRDRTEALSLWVAQLVVNALWSPVFFGAERPGWALVVIAVLIVLVARTGWATRRVDVRAVWLLAPYLAWIVFAAALNLGIVILNA